MNGEREDGKGDGIIMVLKDGKVFEKEGLNVPIIR